MPANVLRLPPGFEEVRGGNIEGAEKFGERPAVLAEALLMPEVVEHDTVKEGQTVRGERNRDEQKRAADGIRTFSVHGRMHVGRRRDGDAGWDGLGGNQ